VGDVIGSVHWMISSSGVVSGWIGHERDRLYHDGQYALLNTSVTWVELKMPQRRVRQSMLKTVMTHPVT